ncbi:MAG: sugar isomerase domain-containing protein, partial [Armatimonadetes bacterium]|nr:sugar isomerase domain-containing protein [Armatimonadota bacterium]
GEGEAVRAALRTGNLRAGDVVVVGSVSGRNVRPVEIALVCRDIGVRTIGLTSMAYTARVEPLHPSGKRLCDAVDVAIDIGAPYGDAAMAIPGIEVAVGPVSGVGFAVAGWLIWERVMSRMGEAGQAPTVFMSVNREGGQDYYERARRQFGERGY